jgi:D-alanine-D-alanine ligase
MMNTFGYWTPALLTGERWRITVLAGGNSDEREVSLASGAAVATALRERGHRVDRIDPSRVSILDLEWSTCDCVFLALHGRWGEDGQVQSVLERIGVPYTGSGPAASRTAFDKSAAKERFRLAGVPTPPAFTIHETDPRQRLVGLAEQIGFPCVVKPNASGSSIGVTLVRSRSELDAAIIACFAVDDWGLIEQFVAGDEWTVPLFDAGAMPAIRIHPKQTFFDYHAKYHDDATGYDLDHEGVPAAVVERLTASAVAAAGCIGTRGISRVDLMVDTRGQPWVLEVNTIPGFTDHSLTPKSASRMGIGFGELCEQAVLAARQWAARRVAA